jgi:regulatory protein
MVPGMRSAGQTPTETTLRDAALAHLARYGTSAANLQRVLERRIARWAKAVEADAAARTAARDAACAVVARLVAAGAVDDAAFAAARARRLTRSGRSARSVAAHLLARGVTDEALAGALPADPGREFAAAVAFARRRRIGPFGSEEVDPRRPLGMFARAGYGQDIAEMVLRLDREAAEDILLRLRQP